MCKLFTDRLKSIVRAGHPQIQGSLSVEQFRAGRHIRASGHYGAVKEAADAFCEHLGWLRGEIAAAAEQLTGQPAATA